MSSERLFVLDTNVIVSALLAKEGKARRALDKAQQNGLLLMSLPVLAELEEVLTRPKFDKYLTVTERKLFLSGFVKTVQFVEIEETIKICRDPKDDKYLELAINGKATCLVSGDADLLVLNPFAGISILTVQVFLELS
ncbi:MAG: putative toxin-antitoxin system toxin component, PIN family [Pegethrix bostrychoides GSE-TBD4-15B]|jgi:hypothetical protein|uniref:Toxin-antitoxin system toxin component, PIN family n=1 Tax=Pegethrix bostrychoides GSE-TBD4-15B TaxID=2839662 RepID=A0A951PAI5_9CYAN|nr:putative toxin-antitoxin system toxin component, PIN family [Pegethrix bostrychoides GSE-TBD4-15B]